MRDLLLTGFVFGALPFILRNPLIGLLMWVWLGIMNPHRFTWGFAFTMPFAQIVAVTTFLGVIVHFGKLKRYPLDRVTVTLVAYIAWLCVSPFFSFNPEREWELWARAIKIQIFVLVALLLVTKRRDIDWLTWVLALSVGFFGIKGGLFTLYTAGAHRVWGPAQSFIEDNNALALAIIVTIPLFRYLQLHSENLWVRRGCVAAMLLCVISAVGSQSRGAFLALGAMSVFLFIKSRQKGLIGLLVLLSLPIAWVLMPESWVERMASIKEYEQDASAMARINAWWMAWNLAIDRFPIGGGFAVVTPEAFQRYAPNPEQIYTAHSIYFQVLGEHGFIGLLLYLMVFGFTWLNGAWVIRASKGRPDLLWAHDLAAMCQVSLVGYAVGGAFLSLTYFDLPYYIVVILIVLRRVVKNEIEGLEPKPLTAVMT